MLQYVYHLIIIIIIITILLLVLINTMQSPLPMEKSVGSTCLAYSATMNNILQNNKYFTHLSHCEGHVTTISVIAKPIESSERALILLPIGAEFLIKYALYSPVTTIRL